jgi:hypothetical protein
MPHEHWNDVPGDIAGEDATNLPGSLGMDNPDLSPDAMVDALTDNDVVTPTGEMVTATDAGAGSTAGTSYAAATNDDSTIDPNTLALERRQGSAELGGTPDEAQGTQQARDLSIESEGPYGDKPKAA